jgi:hypothetical protein
MTGMGSDVQSVEELVAELAGLASSIRSATASLEVAFNRWVDADQAERAS